MEEYVRSKILQIELGNWSLFWGTLHGYEPGDGNFIEIELDRIAYDMVNRYYRDVYNWFVDNPNEILEVGGEYYRLGTYYVEKLSRPDWPIIDPHILQRYCRHYATQDDELAHTCVYCQKRFDYEEEPIHDCIY